MIPEYTSSIKSVVETISKATPQNQVRPGCVIYATFATLAIGGVSYGYGALFDVSVRSLGHVKRVQGINVGWCLDTIIRTGRVFIFPGTPTAVVAVVVNSMTQFTPAPPAVKG